MLLHDDAFDTLAYYMRPAAPLAAMLRSACADGEKAAYISCWHIHAYMNSQVRQGYDSKAVASRRAYESFIVEEVMHMNIFHVYIFS